LKKIQLIEAKDFSRKESGIREGLIGSPVEQGIHRASAG
jgi:hypothetical protein